MEPWPSFNDVVTAYRKCRFRKKAGDPQIRFEKRLGANLISLHQDLVGQKYRPGRSVRFVVSKPKVREIFAANFRDRVIHHLVVSELDKIWNPKLSSHAFACIKGRGPLAALKKACHSVRRLSQGGRQPVFALQVDIASFFITIHRPTLVNLLIDSLPTEGGYSPRWKTVAWLTKIVMAHDARQDFADMSLPHLRDLLPVQKSWQSQGPDFGIPIGNLTSQFAANAILTGLDHYVARRLKPGSYIRYMDDLLLFDVDEATLFPMIAQIDTWLQIHRYQKLQPRKTKLTRLGTGIEFLGYHLRQVPNPSSPLQVLLPPKKAWDFVKACRDLEKQKTKGPEIIDPLFYLRSRQVGQAQIAKINSRLGFVRHAPSFGLRCKTLGRLQKRTGLRIRPDLGAVLLD